MYNNSDPKSNKITQNPSFSSSLLDEIYRSIDGSDEKFGDFKPRKPKVTKKQSVSGGGRGRPKSKTAVEDEEMAGSRHASMVDKWMEMKGIEKAATSRRGPSSLPGFDQKLALDNDPLFFSSGSSSSDSSFGWYTEAEAVKLKPSCFGPLNKVKTSGSSRSTKKQNGVSVFDDECAQTDKADDSGLTGSKTRALKMYASLKKMKQPISPGGRLTNFISAIFTNGTPKKSKDSGCENKTQTRTERRSKSNNVSTCSSASSFSRSCLNRNVPGSTDHLNNGVRRMVKFLDREDPRTCSQKNRYPTNTFPWTGTEKPNLNEFLKKYNEKKIYLDDLDEDEDDAASDASSDLFELDHLAVFKKDQYCEELPVYETTHMGANRVIARGLAC